MDTLRSQLIKLAHEVPGIRKHLIPILRTAIKADRDGLPQMTGPEEDTVDELNKLVESYRDVCQELHQKSLLGFREPTYGEGFRGLSSDIGGKISFLKGLKGIASKVTEHMKSLAKAHPEKSKEWAFGILEKTGPKFSALLDKVIKIAEEAAKIQKEHDEGWADHLDTFVAKCKPLTGFLKTETKDHAGAVTVTYTGGPPDDIVIRFKLRPDKYFEGDTEFKFDGKEHSYEQRGIGPAFSGDLDKVNPMEMVKEQLDRVHAAIDRLNRSTPIPGIGGMITPERKEQVSALLKAGKTWLVGPAGGMGTGHSYTVKQPRGGYAKKAPAETAKFFGVPSLYVDTYDHD